MKMIKIALSAFIISQCGMVFCHAQPPERQGYPQRQRLKDFRPAGRNQGIQKEQFREPARLDQKLITIVVGGVFGQIKPLLGVNAGPAPSGEAGNAELSEQYRWAGVNAVRTHDLYGPLDLSVIYPDINADPADPASYDFKSSDAAFAAIVDAGLEPYLRLGDSYNNVRIPCNDRERKNLVSAAAFVVRHYRQKAMNGLKAPLRYVEIGNEPDNKKFWPAGFDDFWPFFAGTFSILKKEFPGLKIGGPGFVVATYKIPSAREKIVRFFDYLHGRGIVLDFVSFHLYSNDPSEYYDLVAFYRETARKAGQGGAELHITEWNTEREKHGVRGVRGVRLGNSKDAPFQTAAWIALQEAGTDASYLYRGNDTNINSPNFFGIFYADGRNKPAANAFHLWGLMARFSHKLVLSTGVDLLDREPSLTGSLKPLWILAGRDNTGSVALLLSNIGSEPITYQLSLPAGATAAEIKELSVSERELKSYTASGPSFVINPFTVQFVRLSAGKQADCLEQD